MLMNQMEDGLSTELVGRDLKRIQVFQSISCLHHKPMYHKDHLNKMLLQRVKQHQFLEQVNVPQV